MSNARMHAALALPTTARPVRAWPIIVLLASMPLWILGVAARGAWTPDEPRESDIVWNMSQAATAVPMFAGAPFLEKPPLYYWVAALSTKVFGPSVAAARAPNILYAVITVLCIGALASAMRGETAAIVAALVAASSLTLLRVSIWLAPDACLLAGCSIALLGVYRGYTASRWPSKLAWYALMHAGAAIGFMAKSAPGWIVPTLALLTLILWERRWSELRRWELYAGLALQAALIAPWVIATLHAPDGTRALRVLFWDNLAGRFAAVKVASGLNYTMGHRNWPGRYFTELPFSLLPWTLLVVAAVARGWRRMRVAGPEGTPWRFAVCASIPFLFVLSIAATARDIYAAPVILALALLVSLWFSELKVPLSRLDRFALTGTRLVVTCLAVIIGVLLVVLAASGETRWPVVAGVSAAGIGVVAFVGTRLAARWQKRDDLPRSLGASYLVFDLAVAVLALVAFPVLDRWQDLDSLAQGIHRTAGSTQILVLDPDETVLAMLDRTGIRPGAIEGGSAADVAEQVRTAFQSTDGRALVLAKLPGYGTGALSRWLGQHHVHLKPAGDGIAGELERQGSARIIARFELPQGRRYALLSSPTSSPHEP